ncbi:MAG: NAD synthetase [Acidimicrobiaceae bacterium]|nr:NAD synthetase [Acidimicrobiaceae bacterium]HAB58123.1 NAD synthetase [Acidimicrobiaceae bacterium]
MSDELIQFGYLVAAVLFILGIRGLARPRTAVRGNKLGSLGMLVAVVVTLTDNDIIGYGAIVGGLVVGTAIGVLLATRVQMTGMPQLVALFNGFGGAASLLVAAAGFIEVLDVVEPDLETSVATAAALAIGGVTLTGSIVAFGKLQELVGGGAVASAPLRVLNIAVAVATIVFGVGLAADPARWWMWALVAVSLVLGVTLVAPIGGADMPVVIALLNSLSGLAAAAAGFILDNSLLIIAGSLVGASGLILTGIMCRAMNRTLVNVLFGSIESSGVTADADEVYAGRVTSSSADDVALLLETANRVAMVPGYGMAVAQAQHAVRDLTRALQERDVEVVFGIHPVAGRMPGHMNVLLAEAEIPYEQLLEMDTINPTFDRTDVVIVIGANDVVNPEARENPDSPIAGMPILDVDKARTVVVVKRSLSPGFAGIPNPLFAGDNTLMLFGDGRAAVEDMTKALAEL